MIVDKESKAALFLTAGSFLILAWRGHQLFGGVGLYLLPLAALVDIVPQVALGLLAALLAGRLMKASFGTWGVIVLKLTAIMSVSATAVLTMQNSAAALLLVPFVYFMLIAVLFELKWYEAIVFAVALFALRWAAAPLLHDLVNRVIP
ncbi:MAG: hypothetical protein ACE5KM_21765 [Planctomycetaceae bacterium]